MGERRLTYIAPGENITGQGHFPGFSWRASEAYGSAYLCLHTSEMNGPDDHDLEPAQMREMARALNAAADLAEKYRPEPE